MLWAGGESRVALECESHDSHMVKLILNRPVTFLGRGCHLDPITKLGSASTLGPARSPPLVLGGENPPLHVDLSKRALRLAAGEKHVADWNSDRFGACRITSASKKVLDSTCVNATDSRMKGVAAYGGKER